MKTQAQEGAPSSKVTLFSDRSKKKSSLATLPLPRRIKNAWGFFSLRREGYVLLHGQSVCVHKEKKVSALTVGI